jgi:RNA polymerase sigma-70 factor (ECF subfamily)
MTELPPDPGRTAADDPPYWDAVEKLYLDHQTAARHAAAWILGSPHDPEIEDVMQDALVKAARALPTLRHSERARGWFLKIVIFTARDYRRARSRRSGRESPVGSAENLQQLCCDFTRGMSPEEFPLLRAGIEFINTLPEKQRMAYLLEHFFGLDREDIAEVLGCSPRTVSTHLRRAQLKAGKKFPRADGRTMTVQLDQLRRSEA